GRTGRCARTPHARELYIPVQPATTAVDTGMPAFTSALRLWGRHGESDAVGAAGTRLPGVGPGVSVTDSGTLSYLARGGGGRQITEALVTAVALGTAVINLAAGIIRLVETERGRCEPRLRGGRHRRRGRDGRGRHDAGPSRRVRRSRRAVTDRSTPSTIRCDQHRRQSLDVPGEARSVLPGPRHPARFPLACLQQHLD